MPMKRSTKKVRRVRRMRGKGIMSFLGRANDFLKKSKLVSSVGSALGAAGVPFASQISGVANSLGYGRRGSGLSLAGAGAGMRRCRRR